MMKKKIALTTVLKKKSNQLFCVIDGEVVMLSIENGEYYSFDSIGSFIWNTLENPHTFRQLVDNLMEEYEVNEEVCINDTKPLLEGLLDKELIEIVDE